MVRATHNGRKYQITLFVKKKIKKTKTKNKKPAKYNDALKKDIIHNCW